MQHKTISNNIQGSITKKLLSIWDDIKTSVQTEYSLSDMSFYTWIKPLEIYEVRNDTVYILIPLDKKQSFNYISYKYHYPIKQCISDALHKEYEVEFVLEDDLHNKACHSPAQSKDTLLNCTNSNNNGLTRAEDSSRLNNSLADILGITPTIEEFASDKVISLFKPDKSLREIGISRGLLGITKFMCMMNIQIAETVMPKTYDDVVRLMGLTCGSGLWRGNAEELLLDKEATFNEIIATKEELSKKLASHHVDYVLAKKIVEEISNGGIDIDKCSYWHDWKNEMLDHGIPVWYLWSCEHIKKLLSEADLYAAANTELTAMYYKLYFPEEFYKVFFNLYGTDLFKQYYTGNIDDYNNLKAFFDYEDRLLTDTNISYTDHYLYLVWDEAISRNRHGKHDGSYTKNIKTSSMQTFPADLPTQYRQDIWESIKGAIWEYDIDSDYEYFSLVEPLKLLKISKEDFIIGVPQDKAESIDYIKNKYGPPIKKYVYDFYQLRYHYNMGTNCFL